MLMQARDVAETLQCSGDRQARRIMREAGAFELGKGLARCEFILEDQLRIWMHKKAAVRYPACFRRSVQEENRWVYFVRCQEPIKIGVAADVAARIADLQGANPHELELLAQVRGGRDFERQLHERFVQARIRGEWFRPVEDLLLVIEKAREVAAYEAEHSAVSAA